MQAFILNGINMEKNQIALVTGASRGIGLEWCRQLGQLGYTVILTARSQEKAEATIKKLMPSESNFDCQVLELTDESACKALSEYVTEKYRKLNVLINNAGASPDDSGRNREYDKNNWLNALDPGELLKYMHINAIAPVILTKHLRKALAASGNGKIINTTSRLGSIQLKRSGGQYSYCGSKALLNMLNRCMAFELINDKVTSIVVHPGWVKTDMGGAGAPLSTTQSVKGMIENLLNKMTLHDAGKFYQYDGSEIPW
jgi:NAD(P)-dependent dehydrogenase (short-subunit alcohol dehydrogenase family)